MNDWTVRSLGTLALVCLLIVPLADSHAANRIVGGWPAAGIANLSAENVRLTNKNKDVVATVSRARVVRLIDVLSRVERSAGLTAELFVVQYQDNQPNAFAAGKDGRNLVGITPAMLDLLEDDLDAYAAIFGHELAHLVKQHGADRAARQGFLQGLGLIAGIVIGARTGTNPFGMIDLGTAIVGRAFTRDEEREADRLGIEYMIASGFDPHGAIRLQQRMSATGKSTLSAFLSTHPSNDERIANMQQVIAARPPSVQPSSPSRSLGRKDVGELMKRGNWYGLLALSEEQTKENPTDGFWWFHQGFAHQKLRNHPEAVPAYQNALKHQPEHRDAALNLGFSFLQINQPDKAVTAFEDTIRITPDTVTGWYGLGIAYFRLGQRDKAWDVHQELKKLDPKRAERFAEIASVASERPEPQLPPTAGAVVAPPDTTQVEPQESEPTEN